MKPVNTTRPTTILPVQPSRGLRWALDASIFRHLKISYHDEDAWKKGYFQSYPRAQEYVIDADTVAIAWAIDLDNEKRAIR